MGDDVQVSGRLSGLTPGEHGIHIHAQGACEAPDFMSAGGHFNPHGRKHGHGSPDGAHAGDLPNLTVEADGRATISMVAHGVSVIADRPDSLFKEGGTALVVHAGPDDGVTDPAGNSGARVACGPIVAGPIALPRTGDLGPVDSLGILGGALVVAAGILALLRTRKGTNRWQH
jgi:Cu-Zn family superoxide dismutase